MAKKAALSGVTKAVVEAFDSPRLWTPDVPPPKKGTTRLYRGEHPNQDPYVWDNPDGLVGGWFTEDKDYADYFKSTQEVGRSEKGRIVYIDVPDDELPKYAKSGGYDNKYPGEHAFFFPQLRGKSLPTPTGFAETGLMLGTGALGGLAGFASRLGGLLNPFYTTEQSRQGADALANVLTYNPSPAAAPFLAPISRGVQKAEDVARWDWQQVPGHERIEEIWGQLHPRIREALTLGSDLLL